ncbi:MAG: glycine betaine ABC transporter substrate-binding protein, partial [Pseudomonadota bacterium]
VSAEQDPAWLSLSSAPTAWEPSRYHVGYAAQLKDDFPKVVAFLDTLTISPEDAEAMSYAVHVERRAPEEIATSWIAQNGERIEEWVQ